MCVRLVPCSNSRSYTLAGPKDHVEYKVLRRHCVPLFAIGIAIEWTKFAEPISNPKPIPIPELLAMLNACQ